MIFITSYWPRAIVRIKISTTIGKQLVDCEAVAAFSYFVKEYCIGMLFIIVMYSGAGAGGVSLDINF